MNGVLAPEVVSFKPRVGYGLGVLHLANWKLEAEYIQSCNCDYGCPCNFNALPTRGNCEALVAWNIRTGEFDGTKLDGVKFAWGLSWPKAIHMGNGTARLYVDAGATPAQRKAIEEITGGKHGGGVFEIFPKTFSKVLPTKVTKIDFDYGDGYDSWFNVQGIGEVQSAHIKNPVTGDNFAGEVLFPGGINFKRALVTSAAKWSLNDAPFRMGYENRAGFATVTKYSNGGPITSDPASRGSATGAAGGKGVKRTGR
jgi:hypothetical protein